MTDSPTTKIESNNQQGCGCCLLSSTSWWYDVAPGSVGCWSLRWMRSASCGAGAFSLTPSWERMDAVAGAVAVAVLVMRMAGELPVEP